MSAFQQDKTRDRATKIRQYLETLTDAIIIQTKMAREPDDIRRNIRSALKDFALQISRDGLIEVGQYGTATHPYACLGSYHKMLEEM